MLDDSFLCGFEPSLDGVGCEIQEPKQTSRSNDIDRVLNALDGKKTLVQIGDELDMGKRLVSYCIEKSKGKVKRIGFRSQSAIFERV